MFMPITNGETDYTATHYMLRDAFSEIKIDMFSRLITNGVTLNNSTKSSLHGNLFA